MKTLEALHITNCAYVNGQFLGELCSEQARLRKLDFRGSYQIGMEEIGECVKKHAKTIKSLHIDGEDVSSTEIESVIAPIEEFEELSIYFGQELHDNFMY